MKNRWIRKPFSRMAALLWFITTYASSTTVVAQGPIDSLASFLKQPVESRTPISEQAFAVQPLTMEQAEAARDLLAKDWRARIQKECRQEMEAREIKAGELAMPFYFKVFGEKPEGGRSLFISMHGGGGAPKRVNDGQWENQKRLYRPDEGVYVAPRAPTDTWNLWHQRHIDGMFDRLIRYLIATQDVNPDRVYLMGYSAGGDGVYQLAPRMSDRWAAAAMMAGHPNETSPLGLRNLPFALYMGGKDSAYKRNQVAAEWKTKLATLQKGDPTGYPHLVTIYPDKGHWMDREDASALPWMSQFRRNSYPQRIVWKQDDVTHDRFYWLSVKSSTQPPRAEIVASIQQQEITIITDSETPVTIRLHDKLIDLEKPVSIRLGDKLLFEGKVSRTMAVIETTISERDPSAVYFGQVTVTPSA